MTTCLILLAALLQLPLHGAYDPGPPDAGAQEGDSVAPPTNPGGFAAPVTAQPAGTTRFAGRVIRESDGVPVAGALVYVSMFSRCGGRARERQCRVAATVTSESGAFVLFAPGHVPAGWALAVQPTSETTLLLQRPWGQPGEPPPDPAQLDLRPHAGGRVEGRVVDQRGDVVAGATVSARALHMDTLTTTTDAFGRYAFERLPESFTLEPSFEGLAPPGIVTGALAEFGRVSDLDLVLLPTLSLRGVVRDESGAAVVGARVCVASRSEEPLDVPGFVVTRDVRAAVTTDEAGRFDFASSGVAVGSGTLTLWVPGSLTWKRDVLADDRWVEVRLARPERSQRGSGRHTDG